MAQTLGEKLYEAREERGLSISEVAEQTKISPHYIESIERDDYKPLPGGIFNKGFIKSFAKTVGIDEQEALTDYARQAAAADIEIENDQKLYRPEVLTDDNSGRSMIPTIIIAALILGLMTAGILFGLNYLNAPADPLKPSVANVNSTNANSATVTSTTESSVPSMTTLKVEFKALNQPVPLAAVSDGTKSDNVVTAGSTATYEPKESLTVNYNKWNADKVQMTINGKSIALPSVPLNPKDMRIEFTINKNNLAQIWSTGAISTEVPPVTANANIATNTVAAPVAAQPTAPKVTPIAKPTVAANPVANTTAKPPETKPADVKPPAMTAKPAANRP